MSCHFNVFHLQIIVLSKNDAKICDSLMLIWGFPGGPSGKEPACQCRRHKRRGFDPWLTFQGFPGGASGKEPACQCRRHKRRGFDPWVGKIPWRRAWQPTPVFLPGKSHGQRSLAGYGPEGCKELNTTELTLHAHVSRGFSRARGGHGPGSRAQSQDSGWLRKRPQAI